MIIIIRALPPQKKEAKEAYIKKGGQRSLQKKGEMLLSFYHTCASKQHHVLHIESLLSYHFHILVGIFTIELGLYIPIMGFLKCPRSS